MHHERERRRELHGRPREDVHVDETWSPTFDVSDANLTIQVAGGRHVVITQLQAHEVPKQLVPYPNVDPHPDPGKDAAAAPRAGRAGY